MRLQNWLLLSILLGAISAQAAEAPAEKTDQASKSTVQKAEEGAKIAAVEAREATRKAAEAAKLALEKAEPDQMSSEASLFAAIYILYYRCSCGDNYIQLPHSQ